MIDFSPWRLKVDDGLNAHLWIDKFGGRKLTNLSLVGLLHRPSIKKLKAGLLIEGGKLETYKASENIVAAPWPEPLTL